MKLKRLVVTLFSIMLITSVSGCNKNTVDDKSVPVIKVDNVVESITPTIKEQCKKYGDMLKSVFSGKELSKNEKVDIDNFIKIYWSDNDWSNNKSLNSQDKKAITSIYLAYQRYVTFYYYRDWNKSEKDKTVIARNETVMKDLKTDATKSLAELDKLIQ